MRTSLSTRALEFLLNLHHAHKGREELIGTLCRLAEELQPGFIAGAAIVDEGSRCVFPTLPASCFSTLSHSPVAPPYMGTCAKAVCENRVVVSQHVATDTRFDADWRRLYLSFGLHSVQSAPRVWLEQEGPWYLRHGIEAARGFLRCGSHWVRRVRHADDTSKPSLDTGAPGS